jgi:hypothetical protein
MKKAKRDATDALVPKHLRLTETVAGSLEGLDIFLGDPRMIIERDVLEVLEDLDRLELSDDDEAVDGEDVVTLPKRITAFSRQCAEIPHALARAWARVEAAQAFFTPANFGLLPQVVRGEPCEAGVRDVRWDFHAGKGVVMSEGQYKRHLKRISGDAP